MRLKAISLYTGVGGLDFGFEAAGFETRVALDLDPVACRVARLNRNWPVLEGDITQQSSESILAAARLEPGEADILFGGPPCQPFSKSGYWATGDARRLDDARAGTLGQYLRVLRDAQPRAFLLENVMGLAYSGKAEGLEFLRRGVEAINAEKRTEYSLQIMALNAANFGVPQMRERVFIVGSREGKSFEFPLPTHGVSADLEPYVTAWDAFGGLAPEPSDPSLAMSGKWADLLPSIPEGNNYLWHTARGGGEPLFGWRTRYWNFMLKLAKHQPSWTIQAQPGPATGPFHWDNRKLSVAELSRLQTFPDGLRFDCSRREAQRLIGNAVPSALAEAIALQIRNQILSSPFVTRPLTLIQPRRSHLPGPGRVQPLHPKYLKLIGDHAEHPGTGKGNRAARRFQDAA